MNFIYYYKVLISSPDYKGYKKEATQWIPDPTKDFRDALIIEGNEITFKATIIRNNKSETNIGNFQLVNLNPAHRLNLHQDRYNTSWQTSKYIEVSAGSKDNLVTIFKGYVRRCYSVRRGTEYITYIDAVDTSFVLFRSIVNFSIPKGASELEIIKIIESKLGWSGGVDTWAKNLSGKLKKKSRQSAHFGDVVDVLNEYFLGHYYVENNRLMFKDDDGDITELPTAVISPERGLLSTPIREGNFINFDILFQPLLFIGQVVQLVTSNSPLSAKRVYSIFSIKHELLISSREAGQNKTSLQLNAGFRR